MKKIVLKSTILFTILNIMVACNSTNRLTIKNKEKMFTVEQIKEKMMQVRTGADFPVLVMNLKNLGVTYYETLIVDGSSIFHGANSYELLAGPNYEPLVIADIVDLEQLKTDIANHQEGKSDYFEISRQCAVNGIEKWAVCLSTMTCTYVDKAGNKVLVEQIPDASTQTPTFTIEQIKSAHSKVKSGADFPTYIQDIKKLGVIYYETFVTDGHTDYFGSNAYKTSSPAKYETLTIDLDCNIEKFKADLKEHQQGKTDYLTFIGQSAKHGVEKWAVCMEKMTCTYYNKSGNEILVEEIPQ